ncbi:hypothetical protein SKAU_G00364610 [Synaphobranchus kaupii]|uniref:Uncharacterized protein n=1 Tax=Synaphobranchus kaupii TaxID=118154 RepID=A0A9Q1EEV1_SYNKA|nr:hypothetical protein SKAU_G00364610 [Synaphobranchus kaupii]
MRASWEADKNTGALSQAVFTSHYQEAETPAIWCSEQTVSFIHKPGHCETGRGGRLSATLPPHPHRMETQRRSSSPSQKVTVFVSRRRSYRWFSRRLRWERAEAPEFRRGQTGFTHQVLFTNSAYASDEKRRWTEWACLQAPGVGQSIGCA